jgi:hypothetical protein
MKGFSFKVLLVQFLLLLPSSLLFGQKYLLFIDGENKLPISNLTIRYIGRITQTDLKGKVLIPDSVLRIVVSGAQYEVESFKAPFSDTILLYKKAVEYATVPIEGILNKKKTKKTKLNGRNYGFVFSNNSHFQRFKINSLGSDSVALRFFVSSRKIQKLPPEAKVRIEFRRVNKSWIDTTKLLVYLNDFQLSLVKQLEKEWLYAPNELVFRKDIPKADINTNTIDIPIDSLANIYEELFITIGLTNIDGETLNATRAFDAKIRFVGELSIHFYKPTEVFIPDSFRIIMNLDYESSEYLSSPYFELISTKKSK